MAHWFVLFLIVVVRPMPEPCQTHWPPFGWRAKTYTAAMDEERMPAPRPKRPCVLVTA